MKVKTMGSTRADRINEREQKRMGDDQREKVRDQSYIKQYNIQSVLAMLKQYQPISRTEIARRTGMSPTSITRIVTALLNQGLIYESSGEQRSGRGRKATNLMMNADGVYSVGIHLERSVIRLCVMNLADETLYCAEALVDGECTPEKMAEEAKQLFDRMPENAVEDKKRISAVGVCLSGQIDTWQGKLMSSSWLNWNDVELEAIFSRTFGMTACVENDVKACLIGEKVRMGIPDETDTVYLLVDKGIGMAATNMGLMVRGANNEAGEIEDIPVGKGHTLSDYIRQDRLIARAKAFDSAVGSLDAIIWEQKQGRKWADELLAEFRESLECVVQMIDCIYNPDKLVIGGSNVYKLYPDIAEKMGCKSVCLGNNYEESCMTGAGLIAMRKAVVDRIGHNFE